MQICLQNVKNKLTHLSLHTLLQYFSPAAAAPGAWWVSNECLLICVVHCLVVEHNDINITLNVTIIANENSTLRYKCY